MDKQQISDETGGLSPDEVARIWGDLVEEAASAASGNTLVGGYIRGMLPVGEPMDVILAHVLAEALGGAPAFGASHRQAFRDALGGDAGTSTSLMHQVVEDLCAFFKKDPACERMYHVLLYYKGFQALLCHRVAHAFWIAGEREFARYLNYTAACRFAVDIHPGARIEGGVFLDHGTGIVIGETAVVRRNVSIMQGVTLGGTGKETKDRHPKISEGVLIGAGAKLLGNITVGAFSKIGAGTVLLRDIPARATVVSIPGKVVGKPKEDIPSDAMNQDVD